MANTAVRWQKTQRDDEILAALDLSPMTAVDLFAFSESFAQPFQSLDRARRTLKRLAAARQVRSWRYAMTGEGGGAAPLYYKLTPEGYRTLHQDDAAVPPTKRYLHETAPGRHRHQQALAQYVIRTHIAAHRRGLHIVDAFPENTFRIETPLGPLYPDRRFTIVIPGAGRFTHCIELDNSTESVWSQKSRDSIEMKVRRYLHDLAACDYAYRVHFVITGAPERMHHILNVVTRLQPRTAVCPFYVVRLDDYLRANDPLLSRCVATARHSRTAVLRAHARYLPRPNIPQFLPLATQLALC